MKIIRASFLPVLLLVVCLLAAAQSTGGWTYFHPAGSQFSVNLPPACSPQYVGDTQPKPGEQTYLWRCIIPGTAVYLVGYTRYDHINSISREIAADRDNFNKSTHASLLDQHAISTDGIAGLEFDSRNDKMTYRGRVWVRGHRAFAAFAGAPGTQLPAATDGFMNSFHLQPAGSGNGNKTQ